MHSYKSKTEIKITNIIKASQKRTVADNVKSSNNFFIGLFLSFIIVHMFDWSILNFDTLIVR